MKTLPRVLVTIIVAAGAILFLSPIYAMLSMALKTPVEIATTSPWAWPASASLDNLRSVLSSPELSFARLFWNTAVIAVLSTTGSVLSSSMAAYAFARLQFRGRNKLFAVMLATLMLPGIITMIPSFILFSALGWVNTNLPLWVPAWLGGSAFFTFLLRQFFLGIPRELDEAARMDGANHWTIFTRIILPLSTAALATVAVFSFVGSWTDFWGPLLYLSDRRQMTIELGLRTFQSLRGTQWNLLMAATLLALIPIVIIFCAGQRFFMRGITLTDGK